MHGMCVCVVCCVMCCKLMTFTLQALHTAQCDQCHNDSFIFVFVYFFFFFFCTKASCICFLYIYFSSAGFWFDAKSHLSRTSHIFHISCAIQNYCVLDVAFGHFSLISLPAQPACRDSLRQDHCYKIRTIRPDHHRMLAESVCISNGRTMQCTELNKTARQIARL